MWQPPAAPYQPPPGGPYQQPPRKRRLGLKITLGIIGGFIVLIVIAAVASAVGGGSDTSSGTGTAAGTGTGTGNSQAAQSAGSSVARIGDKVRDGKFEFVVTKVAHRKRVGNTMVGEIAQGTFTVISLQVTNIGSESQTLDDSSQYVFDASGRRFTADSVADTDLSGANLQTNMWLNAINPGLTVHGRIAFDMPAGDKAVKIELRDSMFSNGVTVRLS